MLPNLIFQPGPVIVVFLFSAAITIFLIILFLNRNYTSTNSFWFIGILTVSLESVISQFFVLNSNTQQVFTFWNYWNYIGIVMIPIIIFCFIVSYINKQHLLHTYWYIAITAIPFVALFFLSCNTQLLVNFDL